MSQAEKGSLRARAAKAALVSFTTAAVLAASFGAAAAPDTAKLAPRWKPAKSLTASLGPGRDPATLVLKLADSSGATARGGRLATTKAGAKGPKVAQVQEVLNSVRGAEVAPLFTVPAALTDLLRQAGERNTGQQLADLSQYFVVRLPAADAESEAAGLLANLLALPQVENAYAYARPRGPVDIPPTTPDLANNPPGQGYRNAAPQGIGIDFAWSRGFRGQGVTVTDVETNWNLAHEDLDHLAGQNPPVPLVPQNDWRDPALPALTNFDHGTATLGVLTGGVNAYGTSGLVPDSRIHVVPVLLQSNPFFIGPNAVLLATLAMQPGDVMLLEVEKPFGANAYPFELDDVEYAVVRQATALGIHVIEPAGNSPGGANLDTDPIVLDAATGRSKFDVYFRDSGAVVIGGGDSAVQSGVYHNRYVNSNFGTRVGTYAWGNNVTTLGYGPRSSSLANCANSQDPFPLSPPDLDQQYTFCYNGTSAAGAIVAGAAAVLDQAHRARFGQPFTPRELRHLLGLGTPSFGGVGHQPDLAFQLGYLDEGLIAHLLEAEARTSALASVAELGTSVGGVGDVDGDGRDDFLVGAPGYTVTTGGLARDSGRVYLFSGADGSVLLTVDGAQGDRLGTSVDGVGDLSGDLVPDFIAGAVGPFNAPGKAVVFSGADGSVLLTVNGTIANDQYGASVAGAGDLSGDGTPDLLIGVPGFTGGCFASARVELRSGTGGALLNTFTSGNVCDDFGHAVAAAGDVDADGKADVVIGAPAAMNPSFQTTGGAFVFTWNGSSPLLKLFPANPVGATDMRFGSSVAGAGDLGGDGRDDLLVGAPEFTPTGLFDLNAGRLDVISGTGALIQSFRGANRLERLGESVAGVGDFTGDGTLDVAAGSAPGLPSPGFPSSPGKATVFVGPFPQPPNLPKKTHVFTTKDAGTRLGLALAAVGDVNGDGKADLAAGEPYHIEGRASVFSATPGPGPLAGLSRLVADLPVLEASDPDNDGFNGGGTSPSRTLFHIDAGPAFAGGVYLIVSIPDLGPAFIQNAVGVLDAEGKTSSPQIGPFANPLLCGAIGAKVEFTAAAAKDLDGDGTFDIFTFTNNAQVEVITEFPTCP